MVSYTLYDSDDPDSIPDGVAAAGYCDGYAAKAWNERGWSRFPNAKRIAVFSTTNDGDVGDVETGDMLPWELPDWVLMRRAAGVEPWGYVNLSNWNPTKTEFELRGIPEPPWWVADYDGVPEVPAGAVAKQYADPAIIPGNPHYDLSIVSGTIGEEMEFVIDPTGSVYAIGTGVRHIGPLEWATWTAKGFKADTVTTAEMDEILSNPPIAGEPVTKPSYTFTATGTATAQ
jgi:hypothetical protein